MREVSLGPVTDFPPSGRMAVDIDGIEIGIFRVDHGFVAYLNTCAHMGGPVCLGKIIPRVEEVFGEDQTSQGFKFSKDRKNIVCPWHGYEFDIRTGQHHGCAELRLQNVPVEVKGGDLVVMLQR
jgi:nitrite reductase/ring-hydroxylating ferredoxin subunit